jgi:hypothetical protein
LLAAGPVLAAAPAPARVDSVSVGRATGFRAPFWVMVRSAAIPGWGQVYNHKWIKSIVLGGTESAFIYGVVSEDRLAVQAAKNATTHPDQASYWDARMRDHLAFKKDYTWWGAFTILLSMGDAFVDAHLRGFKAEFREEDSAVLLSFEVHP